MPQGSRLNPGAPPFTPRSLGAARLSAAVPAAAVSSPTRAELSHSGDGHFHSRTATPVRAAPLPVAHHPVQYFTPFVMVPASYPMFQPAQLAPPPLVSRGASMRVEPDNQSRNFVQEYRPAVAAAAATAHESGEGGNTAAVPSSSLQCSSYSYDNGKAANNRGANADSSSEDEDGGEEDGPKYHPYYSRRILSKSEPSGTTDPTTTPSTPSPSQQKTSHPTS